ncbi:MAG: hypothetical protein IPJ94_26655 [Chloroflexi bacterium]|nr:hypothetical protein [Chloroflexota bacterium]
MTVHGYAGLGIESWQIPDYFSELLTLIYPPEARLLFALCGLFASPLIPKTALIHIAANARLPETLLTQLEEMSLLQHHNSHTLSLHPLLHEYAADYVQHLPPRPLKGQFVVWYAQYAAERRGNTRNYNWTFTISNKRQIMPTRQRLGITIPALGSHCRTFVGTKPVGSLPSG